MGEENQSRSARWPWVVIVGLPVLVIAYPLSYGPISWLGVNGYIAQDSTLRPVLEAIYTPLIWMALREGVFFDFMEWYLGFWID